MIYHLTFNEQEEIIDLLLANRGTLGIADTRLLDLLLETVEDGREITDQASIVWLVTMKGILNGIKEYDEENEGGFLGYRDD